MEERILDEDEGRGIRIKRTADGETDAVEGTEGEEEVAFEFPEEYDETLAGMSQTQVEEELARREKAKQEALEAYQNLLAEGNSLLAEQKFPEAEAAFAQAIAYDAEGEEAVVGLFTAATKNLTDTERLYSTERAEDLERLETGRKFLREKFGETLRSEEKAYREEADTLIPAVREKQSVRREAFAANKKHYIIRTCTALFLVAAFAIATAIAADNILKTQDSVVPLVLTIVFGVLTFFSVTVLAVSGAKLVGANRLCKENEKLSSTKDGARLSELYRRLDVLDVIFENTSDETPAEPPQD